MKKIEQIKDSEGNVLRTRVYTINTEEEKTQQQYKDICDVNLIMKKHEKGLPITHLAAAEGVYADLPAFDSLLTAKMAVIRAEEAFMTLPAELRAKCGHSPEGFIKMLQDGTNDEELIKLGIKKPKSEPLPNPDPIDPKPKT